LQRALENGGFGPLKNNRFAGISNNGAGAEQEMCAICSSKRQFSAENRERDAS
jgi:hypothetical protein